MIEMNTTVSAIKGVLDNLRMQIGVLDAEIKAAVGYGSDIHHQ